MKARKERVEDIYTEIVGLYGYFPCVHQLAGYMRIDDSKVRTKFDGVPAMKDGRRIRYRARAVAERLADMEAMPL